MKCFNQWLFEKAPIPIRRFLLTIIISTFILTFLFSIINGNGRIDDIIFYPLIFFAVFGWAVVLLIGAVLGMAQDVGLYLVAHALFVIGVIQWERRVGRILAYTGLPLIHILVQLRGM